MDEDEYKYQISELQRKLNLMSKQVEFYEDRIKLLNSEKELSETKLSAAAQDNQTIRTIMTNNITDSNDKIQNLLSEIKELKEKIPKTPKE